MASISSLTGSSSTSSIYGTRNVISGLASGLDTESLIKNMISGYETKLTKLQQTRTKTEWKQEMYRSMISKMSNFLSSYSSYASSTNLKAKSFFTNSVNVSTNGAFSNLVSASGKTSSNVKVLGVKQLATAATYTVKGNQLDENLGKTKEVDESGLSAADGKELSVTLDGVTKKIKLSSAADGDEFAQNLQDEIDKAFGANKVTVKDVSQTAGKMQLEFATTEKQEGSTLKVSSDDTGVQQAMGMTTTGVASYLDTSRTLESLLGTDANGYLNGLTPTGKQDADGNDLYELKINDTLVGTYTKNTSLDTIMNDINSSSAGVSVNYSKTTNRFQFTADETGEASDFTFNDGLATALFGKVEDSEYGDYTAGQDAILTMEVNGQTLDNVSRTSNTFEVDGMTISLKGEFGYAEDNRIQVAEGVYKAAGYNPENSNTVILGDGTTYVLDHQYINENGQYVTEDGTTYEDILASLSPNLTLSGVAVDGGTFLYEDGAQQTNGELIAGTEPVTFTTATDSDKIVNAVKKMVEDYNAMATEIKKAYSTMPEQKSNGDYYEPLTDEDKADMSESSIENYEEKVKSGLLFGDRDLSNLYYQMVGTLDAAELESIGITQNFKDGLTTLEVNEDKLRSALDTDVEHVYEVLGGEDGLVTSLQDPLEAYGKTTGSKGILVEKAGSELAPSTLYSNEIFNELQDIDKQVEKWQDYINDQIDRYTSKFTYLEQLIAQMNNQSSMIYSLGGGY